MDIIPSIVAVTNTLIGRTDCKFDRKVQKLSAFVQVLCWRVGLQFSATLIAPEFGENACF